MKRREFLKNAGLASVAAGVAPKVGIRSEIREDPTDDSTETFIPRPIPGNVEWSFDHNGNTECRLAYPNGFNLVLYDEKDILRALSYMNEEMRIWDDII